MDPSILPPPILVRVEEAARVLGISRSRVYELISRGELGSIRIGRSRRIPMADLQAFVERLKDAQIPQHNHRPF